MIWKQQLTVATYSASVVDCATEYYFEKTNKQEKIRENDKY
jgi:hypothetical protein